MKFIIKLCVLALLFTTTAFANTAPLAANKAFQLTATAKDYQTILLQWKIAPNYYLYKKHFTFHVLKPQNVQLAEPLYPSGYQPLKTQIGTYNVYANNVTIPIPIINATAKNLVLQVGYQGCSKAGFCYPPTDKMVAIDLTGRYMQWSKPLNIDVAPVKKIPMQTVTSPEDPMTSLLTGKNTWLLILGFLGFGILISFTPCVLPMIPILSSMILGQKKMSHAHSFLLSLFYVLGMAITYAIAGLLFGLIGGSIQADFQKPWIIILFSLLFVAMALSLFGLYNIQLPEKLRSKIANTSNHQKKGTYFGAAIMGCLSTLILSPCVTPPLVAVLGFISQTGNAWIGGSALLVMGIGMGFPLLLIGALGPKVLPHSGPWMVTVKNIMGILMLAVAVLMIQRILPPTMTMLLWAALSIGTGILFGALTSKTNLLKKMLGILFFAYGILLAYAAYQGKTNPLKILSRSTQQTTQKALHFQVVHTLNATQKIIERAASNQIVMIDFYADWCIACHELDTLTFSHQAIQTQLTHIQLVRADVTQNSPIEKKLMKHFNVIAPPAIIFYRNKKEIPQSRIIGFINADKMKKHLKNLSSNR